MNQEALLAKEVMLHGVTKWQLKRLISAIIEVRRNHDNNVTMLYGVAKPCSCPACEILEDALKEAQA
jgi:hypothetical protein